VVGRLSSRHAYEYIPDHRTIYYQADLSSRISFGSGSGSLPGQRPSPLTYLDSLGEISIGLVPGSFKISISGSMSVGEREWLVGWQAGWLPGCCARRRPVICPVICRRALTGGQKNLLCTTRERWGFFLFQVWGTAWTVRPGIPFLPVLGCARPQREPERASCCGLQVPCTLQMAGDHPHRPREAIMGPLTDEPPRSRCFYVVCPSNEPAGKKRSTRIGKRAAVID
jgi:hypothetical protein